MAVFNGTSGADSFVAPTGTNTINGLGGVDTISFSFRLVDATFSWVGNQVIIDTPTTHLTVTGIEVFQFTDGTVNENDGNPLVDDLYYYSQYHDVWTAGVDADAHYNGPGWHEGRNPNAFFNTNFYLSIYQDVRALGINPLVNYDTIGWILNRDPSGNFDTSKYLAANPDVAAAHVDPLAHFLAFGAGEGRQPFPTTLVALDGFDYVYYLANNPDVAAAHVDPLLHFLTFGWQEGRNPNAFFDTQGYLATYPDVAAAHVDPLVHYDIFGWREGRDPGPGFNSQQYLLHNPDVAAAGVDPLVHYLLFGINEGRAIYADPVFDTNGAANTVLEGAAAGTAAGITVSWGNWVSPSLFYSISSDSSSGGFTINATTGAITVADSTKIDFETSGASHSYSVTVVAHDGAQTASQAFTINVGDVGATAPVDSNGAANTVAEGAANGTAVGITLSSTEPNGPPVTYSLSDSAGGRFAIDPNTGVVTVANAALIDFETSGASHQYTITGLATAGAVNTPTQNFTINVTDVGPSVPTDSNAATNTVLEGAANGTAVGVTASSSDPNGPAPTFSLTDSAGGRFAINASSGVVTVANGSLLDFETAHSHAITVQATAGALSNSQTFTIAVGDVNDNAPVFTSSATRSVAENTTAVVALTTTDADTVGTNPPTFSITGGADQALFTITGGNQLAFSSPRDFETQAHSYAVQVTANDGANNTVQNITVTLTDANDNAPVFTSSATPSVAENSTAVVNLVTTDADTVGTNPPVFSISGGANAALFTITGGNHLAFIAPRDFETQAHSYAVQVTANDGTNSTIQNITVALTDLNDTAPTFTSSATPSVAEGTTAVVDLTTTDPDTVGTNPPVFSISGGANAALFTITGGNHLSFIAARDFETQAHSYAVQVTANDGVNNKVQNITVALTDVNDNAPVFTSSATPSVAENTTAVVSLATTDADTVGTNPPTFTITGGADQGLFTITGGNQLAFIAPRDFETQAHSYAVQVTANDGTNNTVQNVTVTLTDANDNAPVFTSSATASVAENTTAVVALTTTDADTVGTNPPTFSITGGADSALFTITGGNQLAFIAPRDFETQAHSYAVQVTANDGTNNTVQNLTVTLTDTNDTAPTFTSSASPSVAEGATAVVDLTTTDPDTIGTNPPTFTITGGADSALFTINGANHLAFVAPHDFETEPHSYAVQVTANDGVNNTVQNLTVALTDVNDNAPVFTSSTTPSVAENTTAVVDLTTTDADTVGTNPPTFTITGGADSALFTINGANHLAFVAPQDFETEPHSYAVQVTANDGVNNTVQNLTVALTDVNDNAPVFTSSTTPSVAENTTAVVDLTTTDADTVGTNPPTFTITGGADSALFTINGANHLAFVAPHDFETEPHSYAVQVTANDGANATPQNITVTLTDTNDTAPTFTSSASPSIFENSTAVVDLTTTDPDTVGTNPPTFTVTGGADQAKFTITGGNHLAFVSAPDFENPTDSGTDNIYDVQVTANDGTNNTVQSISVTVQDNNDPPTLNATPTNPVYSPGVDLFNSVSASTIESGQFIDQLVFTVSNVNDTDETMVIDGSSVALVDGNPDVGPTGPHGVNIHVGVAANTATVTISASGGILASDMAAIVDGMTYTDASVAGVTTRAVTITSLHDTGGNLNGGNPTGTPNITSTINFDQPPTITAGATLNYTEDDGAKVIDNTIAVNDPDNANLQSATVKITGGFVSGEDVLSFTNTPNITGNFVGNTLTLTGPDTLANYQAALRSVKYTDTSQDPSGADRTITWTVNDGSLNNTTVATSTIHVTPVNDQPTLSATGLSPGFTENGSAVDLYSTVAASTVEAGQNLDQLILTVTNVAGSGATESLFIDGTTVELNNGNSETTLTHGMTASVALAAGTATVTVSKVGGILASDMQALIDALAYGNTSDDPGAASRVVTITSLRDTGSNVVPNDNINSTLSVQSTVAVTPVNDPPTLTATSVGGTFIEDSPPITGSGPVDLFSTPHASTIEAGQAFKQIVVTVSNVADTTEFLDVSGTAVDLTNGNSEGITVGGAGGTAGVALSSGTATVTINATTTFTQAQLESLVDSLAYDNNSNTPTATTHTITVTSLTDSGGTASGGHDTSALSLVASVAVTPTNDSPTAANFNFSADSANDAIGNTSLVLDNGALPAPPDPAGPQKTITGNLLTGASDPDGPGPLVTVAITESSTHGGTVTINSSGEFSYTPAAGYIGTDTFTYQVSDQNTPTAGLGTGTVTINVATPHVWYVNADAGTDGDGTSAKPFNTLSHFAGGGGVDGAGDTIFVYNATNHLTGGLTLESNEKLIGQDVGLTVNGTTLETATGVNGAIIDGGVVLGIDNTISGVTLGNTGAGGTALSGTSFGTLNVDHTVVNTNNNGMVLSTGAFGAGAAFTSFTSAGATDVSLTSVTGSVDLGTGTMSGQFAVSGGTVSTTYSGNLSQANNAAMVSVSGGHNTGTLTFQTGTLTATNGTGLQFDNADGTYNFNGTNTLSNSVGGVNANAGIDIVNGSNGNFSFSSNSSITGQTSTGETAFNVSGAGTGNITYAGTIGATGATDNAGTSVSVTGHTGGTVAFTGSILDSSDTGGGIGVSGNANTTINFSGAAKTLNTGIGDAVSLSGNTGTSNVNFTGGGLDIDTTNGTGFHASGAGTYSVTGSGNTITTATTNGTGTALNLANVTVGAGGVTFDSATTTANATPANSSANGILLDTLSGGDITVSDGSIAGVNTRGVDINATSNNISIGADISTSTSGRSVEVTNTTGNKTIALSGAIDDNGLGVNLTTNTGTTMNFTGGVQIDATGANNGFVATGGGTVNVTGASNHIATTTGTALNVANTNIGSSGLTFHDISANGGTNGIVLNTTGTGAGNGGLTVTGTSTTAGTGGTIQETTQGAILTSTKAVSLSNMNFTNADHGEGTVNNVDSSSLNSAAQAAINMSSVTTATFTNLNVNGGGGAGGQQVGINGQNVSDLTIANSTVTGFGDEANEGDVKIWNLTGTSAITNSTFGFAVGDTTAGEQLIDIRNGAGTTLTLNATGNTFNTTRTSANGGTQLQVTAASNSTINLNASNNDFLATKTSGIETFARDTSTMNVNITDGGTAGNGNNFDRQGGLSRAIGLNAEDTAHLNFNVNRNLKISGSGGPVINIAGINDAVINGRIDNNGDIQGGGAGSVGSPILVQSEDSTKAVVDVSGNTITNVGNDPGIFALLHGDGISKFNATLDINIVNNHVAMVGSNTFGILLSSGADNNDATLLYANVQNNVVTVGGSGNTAFGIENTGGASAFVYLQGFTTDGVTTWNNRGNTPLNSYAELINVNEPAAIPAGHNGGTVSTPSNPNAMLAASGGVESASATPGETNLAPAQLEGVLAAAVAYWVAAGATSDQLAKLEHVTFEIGDAMPGWLAQSTAGHVLIDASADGHGWFVDQTPFDSAEFANMVSDTRAFTDPDQAAAGHMDLLTVVMHEMGEQLGLEDQFGSDAQNGIMSAFLQDGERRIPDSADVTTAQQQDAVGAAQAAENALPAGNAAAAGSLIVPGASGDDNFNIAQAGTVVVGGAGADTFAFAATVLGTAGSPVTHIADYSALQGDIIDVSAIVTLPPIMRGQAAPTDADMVRVAEDASGAFATLEVNSAGHWMAVAQLDAMHAGDAVNVVLDGTHAPHQLHAAWLA
jgi:large repetitive protein